METYTKLLIISASILATSCGGGSSSSTHTDPRSEKVEMNVRANGGTAGDSGTPGQGGGVYIASTVSGDIALLASGDIDTSYTTPELNDYDLGTNPLTISSNTTILTVAAATDDPAAGTPYMVEENGALFISDDDGAVGDEDAVTGLLVEAGVTLYFSHNFSAVTRNKRADADEVKLSFHNDLVNKGTISTVVNDNDLRTSMDLRPIRYFGFAQSTIDLSGERDGQHGGWLYLMGEREVYNRGDIISIGADSSSGDAGNGGYISISNDGAGAQVINEGDIYTLGGNSETADGGHGQAFKLSSLGDDANVINAGNYYGYGGTGYVNGGHSGGKHILDKVYIESAGSSGNVKQLGNIDIHGGRAITGVPGDVTDVYIESVYSGDVYVAGVHNLVGGSSIGIQSNARNGGNFAVAANGADAQLIAKAAINVSGGHIIEQDGSDGNGGHGGDVAFGSTGSITIVSPSFSASGSDGASYNAGWGGDIVITTQQGSIENNSNFLNNAGSAINGTGAQAGPISIEAIAGDVINNGLISANGGHGKDIGGAGHNIGIQAEPGVFINNGEIFSIGGNANSIGGNGGDIDLQSITNGFTNNGTINNQGGSGTTPGRSGIIRE